MRNSSKVLFVFNQARQEAAPGSPDAGDGLALSRTVETRWNTYHDAVKSFVCNYASLKKACFDPAATMDLNQMAKEAFDGHHGIMLTTLKDFILLTGEIKRASLLHQGQTYVTISWVIPTVKAVVTAVDSLVQTSRRAAEAASRQASGEPHLASQTGECFAKFLLGELKGRFYHPGGVEEQDLTTFPALLDPNVGEDAFMDAEAAKEAKARLLMAVRSTQVRQAPPSPSTAAAVQDSIAASNRLVSSVTVPPPLADKPAGPGRPPSATDDAIVEYDKFLSHARQAVEQFHRELSSRLEGKVDSMAVLQRYAGWTKGALADIALEEERREGRSRLDPLLFWASPQLSVDCPRLRRLARQYLALPSSGAISESTFSYMGNIVTKNRSRLDPALANDLVVLKHFMTTKGNVTWKEALGVSE